MTPLSPVKPTTGKLSVAGPIGMSVMIGSTAYPPAPCELELPPGHYSVKPARAAAPAPSCARSSSSRGAYSPCASNPSP